MNYYTIKKFNKGLKPIGDLVRWIGYYTIKKFNKGLKPADHAVGSGTYYTIKKFNKGLKPFCVFGFCFGVLYHKKV